MAETKHIWKVVGARGVGVLQSKIVDHEVVEGAVQAYLFIHPIVHGLHTKLDFVIDTVIDFGLR